MSKNLKVTIFVEGETEKKLVEAIGILGEVRVFNLVQNSVRSVGHSLRRPCAKQRQKIYVLFDIDVILSGNTTVDKLLENIQTLEDWGLTFYLIQQTNNLEDELCKAGYKNLKNLFKSFNAQNTEEFKRNFCKTTNLATKLKNDKFCPEVLWKGSLLSALETYASKQKDYTKLRKK